MNGTPQPAVSGRTRVFRGREFLYADLPDSGGDPGTISIARVLAGRYRTDELLSVGESTVLFRGLDTRTQRSVVVKTLRSDSLRRIAPGRDGADAAIAEIRRLRHQLQTERRLLVRLWNAGCVVPSPIDYAYDLDAEVSECLAKRLAGDQAACAFLAESQPYLVLPFLAGATLEQVIAEEFPRGMEEGLALRGLWPVVRALAALHEPWKHPGGRTWHCVYQDLKASNVMIDPLGRPLLLDFGGCQVVVDGVPVLEGSWTAGYGPPECEGPARVLLPCADVYTIGSTLYHMLTGFDPRDLFHRWRGAPGGHLDLRHLPRHCSAGVRRLLERCLAVRPSERLADAEQVARAISELISP